MDWLYTIGHSDHRFDQFLALLSTHGIETVIDVRSHPYSRFHPQFRYRSLSGALEEAGVAYLFYGKALGARPQDPSLYEEGRLRFDRLARTKSFLEALASVRNTCATTRVCLMCAEKEPLSCHRGFLICRELRNEPLEILHILHHGVVEGHREAEQRLVRLHGLDQERLFGSPSREKLLEKAYGLQIEMIMRRR
jgi:uncharacterized protein (DUF488 family)